MTKKPATDGKEGTARGTLYPVSLKRVPAFFFQTEAGREPVGEWLNHYLPRIAT